MNVETMRCLEELEHYSTEVEEAIITLAIAIHINLKQSYKNAWELWDTMFSYDQHWNNVVWADQHETEWEDSTQDYNEYWMEHYRDGSMKWKSRW